MTFMRRNFGGYVGLNGYAFGGEIQPELTYIEAASGDKVYLPFSFCFEREKGIFSQIFLWFSVIIMLRKQETKC